MSLPVPKQRITTSDSLAGRTGRRCSRCDQEAKVFQRNDNHEWLCAKCDPSLNDLIRVVEDGEAVK